MNLFKKRKYIHVNMERQNQESSPVIPDGLWIKCDQCNRVIYKKEVGKYNKCPGCNHHFRLSAKERLEITVDEGTFQELDTEMSAKNPMNYPNYEDKVKKLQADTNLKDAVITGEGVLGGYKAVFCIMDSGFIMGSMGSVVGEKITRAIEYATQKELPVIIFTTSGGARMQEGIISLMQMAKVSAALYRHSEKGLLYVTVLTDPTTGGVTASFAMLGDIILSEPKALIGFAGRRVIEQTIKQQLPGDFQTAEFLLEHGFIDKIVDRQDLREVLTKILKMHMRG